MTAFNAQNTEWKTGQGSLFLGEQPALHDTINVRYPNIASIAAEQISRRWIFNEFSHEQSRLDLVTCPRSIYQVMLMNLSFQWEADSVASRAIAPLFAPYVTNSELWEALMENTNLETTHAKTYSDIVRQCVTDPNEVFKMVMENERTLDRATDVNKVFEELEYMGAIYKLGKAGVSGYKYIGDNLHYEAVFRALVALYALERIQFMSSFAATFALSEQGYFQSIAKAVQKIMQDELFCHAELDKEILRIEISTERGSATLEKLKPSLKKLLDSIVDKEVNWGPYLFSEGRAIIGLNAELLKEWVWYNAQEVYDHLGIDFDWERVVQSPLPWMENWIDIDKVQNANQELSNNNYLLNTIVNDTGTEEFEFEFEMKG